MENKTFQYINKLFDENNYEFKFSHYSESSLLPTCFSIMTCFLINYLDKLKNKDKICKNILNQQNKAGYFIDKKFDPTNVTSHKKDYIEMQFTYFSLITLDLLGVTLPHSLKFMERYLRENFIKNWLHTLNFGKFWYESNKIMFIFYFFSYLDRYGNNTTKEKSRKAIETIFNILDDKIDKKTGFWGTNLNENNFNDAICGAAHIFMYYEYYRKEIKYKQKIIDTTLTFVKKNGLWGTIIGGACEDYDGIEILLRLARETEYRKDDIKRLVQKTKKTILRNELEGSFPYRFFKESIKLRWFTPKSKLEKIVYAYSGLNFISTPLYFPDIWATYFRILTIKRIDIYLQGINNISMYTLPAWGYF